jgi:hypothetical protein
MPLFRYGPHAYLPEGRIVGCSLQNTPSSETGPKQGEPAGGEVVAQGMGLFYTHTPRFGLLRI